MKLKCKVLHELRLLSPKLLHHHRAMIYNVFLVYGLYLCFRRRPRLLPVALLARVFARTMNNNPEYKASCITAPVLSQANVLIPSGLLGRNCAHGAKSFYLPLSMESMDWVALRVAYALASFGQDPDFEAILHAAALHQHLQYHFELYTTTSREGANLWEKSKDRFLEISAFEMAPFLANPQAPGIRTLPG
ncbi:uncharacterized protein ARMOST_17193 [Armillaria ostoyae]|uniref:Uncharacterized protein n=1 Tax=Armillaria ostoyae TaxID=47428 RepID=A0A284RYB6_ARMOS|nr:uncharacterized protein ARMOST_17193 [Armillaria ostoyae]